MDMNKEHWERIYETKNHNQVSWTQSLAHSAIDYMAAIDLPLSSKIIDIGGGASNFPDTLLSLGYTDITVLDISETALSKSKARLGEKAKLINWIVSDITKFQPNHTYDFWYDRAVFHFLTEATDINKYVDLVSGNVSTNGHFLLGTFSENGPLKCSGIDIKRYSAESMEKAFEDSFSLNKSFKHNHVTPFDTTQEFQFCGFIKG